MMVYLLKRGVILITLLVSLIPNVNISSNDSLDCYIIQIIFQTTSDWSGLTFDGLGKILFKEYKIIEGNDTSDLHISVNLPQSVFIGKKQYDTTLVKILIRAIIMSPEKIIKFKITKGHVGISNVLIYKFVNRTFILLGNFTHEGVNWTNPIENPAYFKLNKINLKDAILNININRIKLKKLVLTFYYPWYGTKYGESRRWYHWGGIIKENEISTAAHFPIFGAYDSKDEKLIKAHILIAKNAGIDGFVCSWWGPQSFENYAFSKILKIAEELNFKVTVYYESERPELTNPLKVADELIYIIKRYSKSKAFLKINKKPVIFIYAVEAHNRLPDFWIKVRNIVESNVGELFLIGDTRNPEYLNIFDGFHIYNELNITIAYNIFKMFNEQMLYGFKCNDFNNFDDLLNSIKRYKSINVYEKLICFTVIPGYDDRKIRYPGKLLKREDGKTYSLYWKMIEKFKPKCILITSWNEWHEGTEIEPSKEFDFKYINITRKFISSFKNETLNLINSNPDIIFKIKLSHNDSKELLNMSIVNIGDDAFGVRIGLDLSNMQSNFIASNEFPYFNSKYIAFYFPIIEKLDKVNIICLYDLFLSNKTFINCDITYYSKYGKKISYNISDIFYKVCIETKNGTELVINNKRVISNSVILWIREGETLIIKPKKNIYKINNKLNLQFQGWDGDVQSNEECINLKIIRSIHIKAIWKEHKEIGFDQIVLFIFTLSIIVIMVMIILISKRELKES